MRRPQPAQTLDVLLWAALLAESRAKQDERKS